MSAPDRLSLLGMRFLGRHGVLAEEKVTAQPFEVDLVLHADLAEAAASDDLAATVDYAALFDVVRAIVEGTSRDLIEALAVAIADAALAATPPEIVESVEVRVRKPEAPIGGSFDTELDIHRTEYGFDRVREDGRLFASSGGFLAATEQKMLAKAEGPGDHSKCLGTHDGGTKLSELPFGQIGMVREKGVSDNEPQYRVAEKFEPLVIGDLTVLVSVRPVGQRMPEQTGIEVGDPEDLPKRIHRENRPGS